MIDVTVETPLSLKQACRLPFLQKKGKPLHLSTIHRWATRGVKGIRLETVIYPAGMQTSAQAVLRFIGALNGCSASSQFSPSQSKRNVERANAILDRERW
ncbi:MAG: DUF1580 domain-containing protein [Verrucomicrobia bacterium]|nr:DUF1580 domain-containing protein [Verrucomicrobiota bacterium]